MFIIVNPRSGRGAGARSVPLIRKELLDRGIGGRIAVTTRPGHAEELAKAAVQAGEHSVVAVGGDGTISEVAGGLAHSETPLGIIAVGTGNDLARTLGLPLGNVRRAFDVMQQKRTCKVDLGCSGLRYFVSLLGVGFPALVAARANRMRMIKGTPTFLLAVFRQITQMVAAPMTITADGRVLECLCTSVLIQNTPFTGGGLRIAPAAKIDDGELDVVLVDDIGRLDLLWNLHRVYRGRHLRHRRFRTFRCRNVEIDSSVALEGTLDGDAFHGTPLEVEIHPRALTVMVPVVGVGKND